MHLCLPPLFSVLMIHLRHPSSWSTEINLHSHREKDGGDKEAQIREMGKKPLVLSPVFFLSESPFLPVSLLFLVSVFYAFMFPSFCFLLLLLTVGLCVIGFVSV